MTTDQRADLERRIRESKYPLRSAAQFTDENDHNPLILQDCPRCHGSARVCERSTNPEGAQVRTLKLCPDCGGTGTTGKIEHYFLTDGPEIAVAAQSSGWLKCPKCGWRFNMEDRHRWTGRRHTRCGQKIRVTINAG